MSRLRNRRLLFIAVSLVVLVLATRLSPWLGGVVVLVLGVFGTVKVVAHARVQALDAALERNDIEAIERYVTDPIVGVRARLALTYARIDTPDLFECTCGRCVPGEGSLDKMLAKVDDEIHVHERLAQAYWMPSSVPKDWTKPPATTPSWSLPFRRVATIGISLARQLESPVNLTLGRVSVDFLMRLREVPLAVKWPATLAVARYASEIGLYGEADRCLSGIPAWTSRSPLEVIRRQCRERLDEHFAVSSDRGGSAEAECAFLRAAQTDDTETLSAMARDPKHHAALASRVLLSLEGARFDAPIASCPCSLCDSADDEATLAALEAFSARLWTDETFGLERKEELTALEKRRISRHARRALEVATTNLRILINVLHVCDDAGCKGGDNAEAFILGDEPMPHRSLLRLGLVVRKVREKKLDEARELLSSVRPFAEGSAQEARRVSVVAEVTRLTLTPDRTDVDPT